MNFFNYIFKIKFIFFIFFFFSLILIKNINEKKELFENELKNYIEKYHIRESEKYDYQNELYSMEKYINLLKNNLIYFDNYQNEIINPKISFIAPVYNKEPFLCSFITSIQNQLIKEFEIIFIDDCSRDNSTIIITDKIKTDKRIKLIQNRKNMGSLFSRALGAKTSKGEYVIFVDADDLILKDGLLKVYKYIKKLDLDIIQFSSIIKSRNKLIINKRCKEYKNIIYQPILSYIYYYKRDTGREGNIVLWDKLIKREITLKAINYIGEKFIKQGIIIENDVVLLFSLLRNSKSFLYLDTIGYYYTEYNNGSISSAIYNSKKSNDIIRSIFLNILFLYQHTGNNYFDKKIAIFKLKQGYKRYKICFKNLNKGYKLIIKVLNRLLYSKFISSNDKLYISNVKQNIIKKKQQKEEVEKTNIIKI